MEPGVALQWVVVVFFTALAIIILFKIFTDSMPLNSLISEGDGKASLSRFQLLLFTMVIVGIYLVLCLEQRELLEVSAGVLGLMGISGGSYVLSKGIQSSAEKDKIAAAPKVAVVAEVKSPDDKK